MLFKIQTNLRAIKELTEALIWYAEQQNDLPQLFRDYFKKTVLNILELPESYPKTKKGFRQALMEEFPYFIVYAVDKKAGIISIVSIFYTSRHPKQKFKNKKIR